MRPIRLVTALATILVVAACTTSTPGWTVAPVPSTTPDRRAERLGRGQRRAVGRPIRCAQRFRGDQRRAERRDRRRPSSSSAAAQVAFDQTALTAPASAPFQIEFTNNDASVPHDVTITDSAGARVFHGETFPGRRHEDLRRAGPPGRAVQVLLQRPRRT